MTFEPLHALGVLHEHGVRFVVIGGVAGSLWGSSTVTNDLDVCYSHDPDNVERLAEALVELDARLRGVDEDVPFRIEPETFAAGGSFTFVTVAGNLDCLAFPAGTDGYDDLAPTATEFDLEGMRALVADLEDLMRMKKAAGRRKDRVELEILAALREERDAAGQDRD